MHNNDHRTVLTLDAGGTNFVFSAIRRGEEIVLPVCLPAYPDNLERCLKAIISGFKEVIGLIDAEPDAISFAFPGPADYENGIIGDLPNFPSFRGGVALGPLLEKEFGLPVFINNDGNLFAYGEALAGALPEVNRSLHEIGNPTLYKNLIAVTLGTGFGCGVVIDKQLLLGDNGCGGDVWLSANKYDNCLIAEEGVSIRAVVRTYMELSGEGISYTPKEIFEIAEGNKKGDREPAVKSFERLGEAAGYTITEFLNIVDGIVVLGGGVSNAHKYILPALLKEMRGSRKTVAGATIPRLQMEVYNLEDERERAEFVKGESGSIGIPGGDSVAHYREKKKTGVMISKLGTSRAVSLGAYYFALNRLDKVKKHTND
ncbi:MAG: ROK family protein [Proteiniphilum sp.]|nr:ROK family protein [Proteiniphilum sp.]